MLRPSLRNLLQISSGKPIATVNITPHYCCYININSPRPLSIPTITHRRHYSNHSNHHVHPDSCTHSHPHSHSNFNSSYSTTPISPHYIPTESELSSARSYLTALLVQHDHPSHVLTPFISPSARDAYLAIKSFNLKTASIADQTHSLALGRLRMAFWRDAIEDVFFPSNITSSNTSKPSYHKEPTILLLSHILSQPHPPRLNKGWFLRALSARESLLSQTPFPSLSQLETYAESTYSSITYLLLESQHIHSTALDHIAGHLGKAAGITAILRGVPITAFPSSTPTSSSSSLLTSSPFSSSTQGAVLLPLDICAKHSLSQEDVLRNGGNAHGLKDVVFEIATRANDHLLTARVMIKEARVSKDLGFAGDWGVLLGALPTRNFLRRLEKVDFDVFDHSLERKDWKLPFHAYWAYKRGEF